MSLQVWLPLNGDLHNQGLSNITVTNNGATVDNNGKIGKCYSFNGSSYVDTGYTESFGTGDFTICCWIYLTQTSGKTYQCIIGNKGTGAASVGISLYYNQNQKKFLWSTADGSNHTEIWSADTFDTVIFNQWHHIVMVRDNNDSKKGYFYFDGIRKELASVPVIRNVTSSVSLKLGSVTPVYAAYCYTGRMNDVRIYDHALSTKEVEEIAKGLVLHYKLDQPNQNLLTNDWDLTTWSKESGISVSWDNTVGMYKVLDSSHTSSRWGIYQNITLSANTTYTFSVDGMKKDQNVNFGFAEGTSWPANAGSFTTTMSRLSKTITVGDADANCRIYLNINPVTDGSNYGYFRAPKLEIGSVATNWNSHTENIIYDCSGYGNNGYISSTININSDGPKYSSFSQLSAAATISHSRCLDNSNQEWTCVAWVKPTTAGNYQNLNNFNSNNRLYHGTYPLLYLNSGTNDYYNYGNMALPANEWSHIAFVFKNSTGTKLIYINGENHTNMNGPNKTSTPAGIPDTVVIGGSYEGGLCDYREYATALTPEQIKELYNTSMSIDDKDNIHTRELVEL